MRLAGYNPEGKKLTYEQHLREMKKLKEKQEAAKVMNGGEEEPWICVGCGESRYKLKAKDGQLIRTCKKCNKEKIF